MQMLFYSGTREFSSYFSGVAISERISDRRRNLSAWRSFRLLWRLSGLSPCVYCTLYYRIRHPHVTLR